MLIKAKSLVLAASFAFGLAGCEKKNKDTADGNADEPQGQVEGANGQEAGIDADRAQAAALEAQMKPTFALAPRVEMKAKNKHLCRYAASAGSDMSIKVRWERFEGKKWVQVGDSDILYSDKEDQGKDLRCMVSVRDSAGNQIAAVSGIIK